MLNAHLKKNASKQKTRFRNIFLCSLVVVAVAVTATSFSPLGQIFDVTVASAQTIGGLRIKTAPPGSVALFAFKDKLYVLNSVKTPLPYMFLTSYPIASDGGIPDNGSNMTLSTKVTDNRYGPGEHWETNWKAEDLTYGTSPTGKMYLFALASNGLGSPVPNFIPYLTELTATRDFRAVFALDVSSGSPVLSGTYMSWVDEFCNANRILGGYIANGAAQELTAGYLADGASNIEWYQPKCTLRTSDPSNMVLTTTDPVINRSSITVPTRKLYDYGGYRYILINDTLFIHDLLRVMEGTTATKAVLNWLSMGGVTSYKLYRSPSSFSSVSDVNATLIATKSGTDSNFTYTDNGLMTNTKYYYRVAYMIGNNVTMLSNQVVIPVSPNNLSAPTISVAKGSSADRAVISWSAISGATNYRLYRSTNSFSDITANGVTSVATIGTAGITSFTDAVLVGGTTYYYRLIAVNDTLVSPISNEASIAIPLTPPVLSAKVDSSSQITLSWQPVPTANGYDLQIGSLARIRTVSVGNVAQYVVVGLSAGTRYSFSARSANASSVSEWSVPITADTPIGLKMGLKVFSGGQALDLEATTQLTPASPSLRVSKGGTVYSMILVPIGDTNASKVRVKTAGGIMAIKKP